MADDKLDAPAFLRMLAQNDYMIDKGTLPDGKRLEEIATEIEELRAELSTLQPVMMQSDMNLQNYV